MNVSYFFILVFDTESDLLLKDKLSCVIFEFVADFCMKRKLPFNALNSYMTKSIF